jgi:hypothetical protein
MAAACDDLRVGIRSPVSSEGVQVSCDVAAILLGNSHLWHRGVRLYLSGMLNPQHEIVGRIGKLTSDVITLADTIQAWTDETSRTRNAGNFVTGIATIFTNLGSPQASITSTGERGGLLDFSASRAIAPA